MPYGPSDRLDLLTRSVYALLQWAETHPLTQWEQAGVLSALRLELEEVLPNETSDSQNVPVMTSDKAVEQAR